MSNSESTQKGPLRNIDFESIFCGWLVGKLIDEVIKRSRPIWIKIWIKIVEVLDDFRCRYSIFLTKDALSTRYGIASSRVRWRVIEYRLRTGTET